VILYCDTSALLKLFVDEEGSDWMIKAREASLSIAVCRLTWAESMAASAQRGRFKRANLHALAQSKTALEQAWPEFAIVDINQPLVEKAGVYAEAFALRGYDSVQLAAAHNLREQCSPPLTCACYDRRLNQAAQLLQFQVLP
jgi:predicted nucleic acid-binding protein